MASAGSAWKAARSGCARAGAGLLLLALPGLGCEIAPVVSAPDQPGTRYADCERASEDYCEHVLEVGEGELERCVAELKFKCVAGEVQ